MIRFLISLVILTLIITYLIIPLIKYIRVFFIREAQRIDKAFTSKSDKTKKEKDDVK